MVRLLRVHQPFLIRNGAVYPTFGSYLKHIERVVQNELLTRVIANHIAEWASRGSPRVCQIPSRGRSNGCSSALGFNRRSLFKWGLEALNGVLKSLIKCPNFIFKWLRRIESSFFKFHVLNLFKCRSTLSWPKFEMSFKYSKKSKSGKSCAHSRLMSYTNDSSW